MDAVHETCVCRALVAEYRQWLMPSGFVGYQNFECLGGGGGGASRAFSLTLVCFVHCILGKKLGQAGRCFFCSLTIFVFFFFPFLDVVHYWSIGYLSGNILKYRCLCLRT